MKFAVLDGKRSEATPKQRAFCPHCGSEVVSKCGKYLIWHWAHLSRKECDKWWKPETVWHRAWKNRFPLEWQEVSSRDLVSGELHIADVKILSGLVLEFQRSDIKPDEILARESFYKQMIWIVDGTKNESDKFNFSNMRSRPDINGIADFHWFGRSTLFKRWHRSKPVFIDFGDHGFWRVLSYNLDTKQGSALLVNIDSFVELACTGTTDFSSAGGPASM
jgi:hypothetical protein